MEKTLVIVESPAKARTISKFLSDGYWVEASIGHIRDLPRKAAEVPEKYKKESWSDLGVNVDDDFQPLYIIPNEKKDHVKKLKAKLKNAKALYLATDEDREGESISWHLLEVLKPKVPVKRLVFHEITQSAIERALSNLRDINADLVHAQETRRIVDRLYGYKVSPLLWNKLRRNKLSAGRVQSVALRMVVERERLRRLHVSSEWWDLLGQFRHPLGDVEARLVSWKDKPIADSNAFDTQGQIKKKDVTVLTESDLKEMVALIEKGNATVDSLTSRAFTEKPAAPFITSTLQQEAIRKFRWTAKRTMRVAQQLYEGGWITYMRTDSVSLSKQAMGAATSLIKTHYGSEFLPETPRVYSSTTKNAQEAHEAIRPAGETFRHPKEAAAELTDEQHKLYDLIWKRTVASQMANAKGSRLKLTLKADQAYFNASGKTYTFYGFRRAYVEEFENPEDELNEQEKRLPNLKEGDTLDVMELLPRGHKTKPKARLTEASLVKALEEKGVGRPSTYAAIIDNIIHRGYIFKRGPALVPTFTAFVVITLMEKHLNWLVDYEFTARMENRLDEIARGEENADAVLKRFYIGKEGLMATLEKAYEAIDWENCGVPLGESPDGESIEIRCGRFGEYVQMGDLIAYLPSETPPDQIHLEEALSLIDEKKKGPLELGLDPETGKTVAVIKGPYGYYVQLGEPEEVPKKRGKGTKTINPKRASLLRGMTPETLDLDIALQLLSLPRTLGQVKIGDDMVEVIASNGRFGPYLKRGKETCSLPETHSVLTVSLEESTVLFENKSKSRTPAVLKKWTHEGVELELKKGRYGPYVTDGKVNASVPKAVAIEAITPEQAFEWVKAKAASPAKPKRRRKKKK